MPKVPNGTNRCDRSSLIEERNSGGPKANPLNGGRIKTALFDVSDQQYQASTGLNIRRPEERNIRWKSFHTELG